MDDLQLFFVNFGLECRSTIQHLHEQIDTSITQFNTGPCFKQFSRGLKSCSIPSPA